MLLGMVVSCRLTCSVWNCVAIIAGLEVVCPRVRIARWVGCSPSVVCRWVARHAGPDGVYQAAKALRVAMGLFIVGGGVGV